jgi:hypothetical protein
MTIIPSEFPNKLKDFVVLLLFLSLFGLSACSTPGTTRFKDFSEAGTGYTNTMTILLDEAGPLVIDTDSIALRKSHPNLPTSALRQETVKEHNQLLKERLSILKDLRQHTLLLKSYFEALAALATDDSRKDISKSTATTVQNLGQLHAGIEPKLTKAAPLTGAATEIIVGHFQSSFLEQELKSHAKTINEELVLQKRAVKAVMDEMQTDLQAQISQAESRDVVLPYINDRVLPPNWEERRREVLMSTNAIVSGDKAAEAVEKLRLAFIALVEGEKATVDISIFLQDLAKMLVSSETLKQPIESKSKAGVAE